MRPPNGLGSILVLSSLPRLCLPDLQNYIFTLSPAIPQTSAGITAKSRANKQGYVKKNNWSNWLSVGGVTIRIAYSIQVLIDGVEWRKTSWVVEREPSRQTRLHSPEACAKSLPAPTLPAHCGRIHDVRVLIGAVQIRQLRHNYFMSPMPWKK
jgi:hypothetical protein